jgi:hypothetical protein
MIAWAGLLALHALIVGSVIHAMRSPPVVDSDSALQVVFLPLHRVNPATPHHPARPSPALTSSNRRTVVVQVSPAASTAGADTPADVHPMNATFLAQGAALAAKDSWVESPPRDLLADRRARLPGRSSERFHMQGPLSPAQIVAAVGGLFGGVDGRAERCARNRDNLATLAVGGDSPELQVELETQRRFCTP